MGDIESMFYQVKKQRRYVQFLWWEDGGTQREVQAYEMCAHLFGGTSSPSCANYALRKAATDGEGKFGKDAATTLRRSFYVDDMLKSTCDPVKTVELISNTRQMCNEGGFKLTKIVSNSRMVNESELSWRTTKRPCAQS